MPSPKRRMGAFNALNDLPSVEDLPLTETPPETESVTLWPWLESRIPAPPHPVAVHRMNQRPRRIGGFNALDDLLPGPPPGPDDDVDDPDRGWPPRVTEQPPPAEAAPRHARRPFPEAGGPQHQAGYNALDDLLPGPGGYAVTYGQGRHARGVPTYQPPPRHERVRMTFLLPADLIEAAEDATAFLAGPPARLTMRLLAEQALRNELDRLADVYHGGHAFPRRYPHG